MCVKFEDNRTSISTQADHFFNGSESSELSLSNDVTIAGFLERQFTAEKDKLIVTEYQH